MLSIIVCSYQVSKLLQLLAVREIAKKTINSKPFVIINTLDPGLCYTDLTRSATGSTKIAMKVMRAVLAWTAEEGGRTLVLATTAGPESHGAYMSGGKIKKSVSASKRVHEKVCTDFCVVRTYLSWSPAPTGRRYKRKFGQNWLRNLRRFNQESRLSFKWQRTQKAI